MVRYIQQFANRIFGISSYVRVHVYSMVFPIGKDTIILNRFNVRNPQKITIGARCYININCFIQGSGEVSIGNDVLIAPNVSIYSENHVFSNKKMKIKDQGFERKPVIIGDDVWIGTNAILLPGVTIGDGSVIGAGAVVTKSFPKNSIIAGVPAKLIGRR